MKNAIVISVGLLLLLFVTVSQGFPGEVRSKTFTQGEIKVMEESKAIIHTEKAVFPMWRQGFSKVSVIN